MHLTSPEHDVVVGIAVRTHYASLLAHTGEQRAAVQGARNVLADVLAKIDGMRYTAEPASTTLTLVVDRWDGDGRIVDQYQEGRAAELEANRRNTANIADGRRHLADAVSAGRDNLPVQRAGAA